METDWSFVAFLFACSDASDDRRRRSAAQALGSASYSARRFGLDSEWFERDMAIYRGVLAINERVRQAQERLAAMAVKR